MLKTIADIDKIRKDKQADMMIRIDPAAEPTKEGGRMHVMVCGGTGCTSSNSIKIIEGLEKIIRINKMQDEVKVVKTGCFGLCAEGPIVMIYPDHIMYTLVKPEDVNEIFDSHIKNGKPVERLMANKEQAEKIKGAVDNTDFSQSRCV